MPAQKCSLSSDWLIITGSRCSRSYKETERSPYSPWGCARLSQDLGKCHTAFFQFPVLNGGVQLTLRRWVRVGESVQGKLDGHCVRPTPSVLLSCFSLRVCPDART